MRAVVDHHVDRPDVEAQQCVKLTGTNRSIGLIFITLHAQRQALPLELDRQALPIDKTARQHRAGMVQAAPGGFRVWTTWWLWRGD
jgi:hypothetical protein